MLNKFNTAEELMDHLKRQIVDYSSNNLSDMKAENYGETSRSKADLAQLYKEREQNNVLWNVSAEYPITSHRKFIGKFIVIGKKIVRKFLRWYVSKPFNAQNEFNGSVTRSINELTNIISQLKENDEGTLKKVSELQQQIITMKNEIKEFGDSVLGRSLKEGGGFDSINLRISATETNLESLNNLVRNHAIPKIEEINGNLHYSLDNIKSDLNFVNYRMRNLLKKTNSTSNIESITSSNESLNNSIDSKDYQLPEFDYLWFEHKYRGSVDVIKKRQKHYLSYFENKSKVIDIGCGRGEFLELLIENNVDAFGVDINDQMLDFCLDRGLPVIKQDGIACLREQGDNSLGGIFLGQVIEHLSFEQITELVDLSYKKLKTGAVIIMETPNPQSLAIFSHAFYMDPTHVKPVHPLTIQFLAESLGFRQCELVFLSEIDKNQQVPHIESSTDCIPNVSEFNQAIDRLNQVLFGYQDYAIIARK